MGALTTIMSLSWEPHPYPQKLSVPGGPFKQRPGLSVFFLAVPELLFGFPSLIPVLACYLAFA